MPRKDGPEEPSEPGGEEATLLIKDTAAALKRHRAAHTPKAEAAPHVRYGGTARAGPLWVLLQRTSRRVPRPHVQPRTEGSRAEQKQGVLIRRKAELWRSLSLNRNAPIQTRAVPERALLTMSGPAVSPKGGIMLGASGTPGQIQNETELKPVKRAPGGLLIRRKGRPRQILNLRSVQFMSKPNPRQNRRMPCCPMVGPGSPADSGPLLPVQRGWTQTLKMIEGSPVSTNIQQRRVLKGTTPRK